MTFIYVSMKVSKKKVTDIAIYTAAVEIFMKKGIHGARMQEIADKANISKSMLHYYFKSKEVLYDKVFEEIVNGIFPAVYEVMASQSHTIDQKVDAIVDQFVDSLIERPYAGAFILSELTTNTDKALKLMIEGAGWDTDPLRKQLIEEVQKGNIKTADFKDFILTLFSLCVFPFASIPLFQDRFNMSTDELLYYYKSRKDNIKSMMRIYLKGVGV